MAEDKKPEKKELTPQERQQACGQELQTLLDKHRCTLIARPSYRLRDDQTWSLITGVEVVPRTA